MKALAGWKTYLAAAAGVIVAGLAAQGYISPDLAKTLEAIVGFLGLAALRAGVAAKPESESK